MKSENIAAPIVVRKVGMQIVVSRALPENPPTFKYDITTNVINTIEVTTRGDKTHIKIMQDNVEIGSRDYWKRIVAIEYPNKDLWSEHPILNELKLISLASATEDPSPDSSNNNDPVQQAPIAKKQRGYLVFEKTERFIFE